MFRNLLNLTLLCTTALFSQLSSENFKCVYGNCEDGFGATVHNDNNSFVYGEFENGTVNGVAFSMEKEKNSELFQLSLFKNIGERLVLTFDKKQDNFIIIKYNDNIPSYKKILDVNNRKTYKKSGQNYKEGFLKTDNFEFKHSIQSTSVFIPKNLFESLKNDIKSKNYYNEYFKNIYNSFNIIASLKNDYSEFIGVKTIGGNKIIFVGNSKYGIPKKGIWLALSEGKIIDFTYVNNDNLSDRFLISKTLENDFLTYNYIDNELIPLGNKSKINFPPKLTVKQVIFSDKNQNELIDANEESRITLKIQNDGNGPAFGLKVDVFEKNNLKGLSFDTKKIIRKLNPKETTEVNIPIKSTMSLKSALAEFEINISEANGFNVKEKILLNIETLEFFTPKIEITDFKFESIGNSIIKGNVTNLKFIVQNTGQGLGENIMVSLNLPENTFASEKKLFRINSLNPGESKEFNFKFFTNNLFDKEFLEIVSNISEKYNLYGDQKIMRIDVEDVLTENVEINSYRNVDRTPIKIDRKSLVSSVDLDVPINKKVKKRYALIIGNEDYKSMQTSLSNEQNVDYAINDAEIFKKYALNTLGVIDENVFFLRNATSGQMNQEIELITRILENEGDKSELIVYYAGHGYPDEKSKIPYLIPVDVSSSNLSRAINLYDFYQKISNTPARKITVFLDACFTGGGRNKGLNFASRGLIITPKIDALNGKIVVFSATRSDQSALPLKEEKHGMFTYFLLKKLQETKGKINYKELAQYLEKEVSLKSLKVNRTEQEPTIIYGDVVESIWESWEF